MMNQQYSVERIYIFGISFSFGIYAHWRFPSNHSEMLNMFCISIFSHKSAFCHLHRLISFCGLFSRLNLFIESRNSVNLIVLYFISSMAMHMSHQMEFSRCTQFRLILWIWKTNNFIENFYTFIRFNIRMQVTRSAIFKFH